MHIAIARFSAVHAERDSDFQDWFARFNDQLHVTAGLMSRRLLRAPDGSYLSLSEPESVSTFEAAHKAEALSMIHEGLGSTLSDGPQTLTFDVVADFSPAKMPRGGDHGSVVPEGALSHQPHGCCHAT